MIDLEKAFDTVWLDGLFYKLLKKEFPNYLVKILWNMLHDKKFYVAYGQYKSSKAFKIDNGLQQGTVNSPLLFNIFISDLLQLYGLNNDNCKKGIAFADDLLIYTRHNKVSKLKIQLQETFNKLQDYFHTWKLNVNINKCESILFRPYISTISDANNDVRTHASKFQIHDSTNPDNKIPHKNVLSYLGLHLDFKLNYNEHILSQIEKAQKSFLTHKRLFYSKELDKCVKILCYKLLVRPILTYGCPIWFNISAGTMEKLRIFERKCLRVCLGKYRSPESDYKKMISNQKIYEEAKITRIDLFILRLIRNHWSHIHNVTSNSLIYGSTYPNPLYFAKMYFPTAWKTAKLIAIRKKGKDGSNPTDYRPISLLANISKIFETTINNAIVKHCETNNVIPETQFGFRHKHSTTHAISKFTADICWARNAGDCVGALFVDLEKAFDTVWWDGLFFKLIKKRFPQHLTKMIWSMLHGKKFRVAMNSHASTELFEIKNGLQQGTVNSPILFSIFISDLLNMYGLNNDTDKFAIAFADDLLIYTKDSRPSKIKIQLQDLLDKMQDYFHTWRLKINTAKCETILFRPYISNISNANADVRRHTKHFHLHDSHDPQTKLQNKNIVRYLGVHIDYRLNYYNHINIQIEKAQRAFANHKRLFYSRDLTTETKIICYKALIRPILTYACPIWFNISASTMEKLRVFERKCLRASLGKYRTPESNYTKLISNHKLHEYANTIRIDLHILKLIHNHWASIRNVTNNSLINSSIYPNPQYYDKTRHTGYIPPEAFIYLDSKGYIQDKDNTPLIYHITRKADDKKILYSTDKQDININTRLNYKLSKIDKKDAHRRNTKRYWWLLH
ncbi:hypothetical protein ANTPLA_LOCUS858 [Anthophora plagiata]